MSAPKKQLNARLPAELVVRLRRVKEAHRMRPSWDTLIENLVTGKDTLARLEREVEGGKK